MVIPTIHNRLSELRPQLESILACRPAKLVLVTTWSKYKALGRVAETLQNPGSTEIAVLHVDKANKRLQVCKAFEDDHVTTTITVMADNDVEWPSTLMLWLLAPFEENIMGGVGTCQRMKRLVGGDIMTRIFNWLGAAYKERRNFEISATHNINGGTSCTHRHPHPVGLPNRPALAVLVLVGYGELGAQESVRPTGSGGHVHVWFYQSNCETGSPLPPESA